MKRLVATMACGAMLTAVYPEGVLAQASQPASEPGAAVPAAAAAAPARHAKRRSWTYADARVCLEFPTNLQIMRCAEKYRFMRVRT